MPSFISARRRLLLLGIIVDNKQIIPHKNRSVKTDANSSKLISAVSLQMGDKLFTSSRILCGDGSDLFSGGVLVSLEDGKIKSVLRSDDAVRNYLANNPSIQVFANFLNLLITKEKCSI